MNIISHHFALCINKNIFKDDKKETHHINLSLIMKKYIKQFDSPLSKSFRNRSKTTNEKRRPISEIILIL